MFYELLRKLYFCNTLFSQTGLCVILADICSAVGYLGASNALHSAMLVTILHSPLVFFDRTPVGRLVNRFGSDIVVMDQILPRTFNVFIWCSFGVLSSVGIISYSTPKFLIVVVPLVIFYWFVQVNCF